ncbi:putative Eukaryotic translation initiation factor 4E [Hypsibius exemplaris]|uniref:Eukaryotic translation initiation factor 4E n=1 Tax=Hypsibius exemplaris TaxID=2072580 RepID=A0A1W0X0B8_HYPEX|nr:putative Eukaryotic translation initiation factor 4E [Hypsibius exemplaris]
MLSPDFLAEMEHKYCSNLVPPDAKNSFRDPTQTYLESPWTLWLVNKGGAQNKTWMECIHPIATFSTIQQFWGMYNTLKPPSELPSQWEYALFRGGIGRRVIIPDWDDTENSGGGCMQLTGFNLEAKTIDHLWRDICLKAIEEAWIHTSDYINGTIVSSKSGTTRFYVWIAPCKEHIWESVRDRIESVFCQDCRTPLKWIPHMERKSPLETKEAPRSRQSRTANRHNGSGDGAQSAHNYTYTSNLPRYFRSRSVGYRAKLAEDIKTDEYLQAKRNVAQSHAETIKEAEAVKVNKLHMPSVKGSVSTMLFRQSSIGGAPYPGHRRGRSCHGFKAYPEFSLFNMPGSRDQSRDNGRYQGAGHLDTGDCIYIGPPPIRARSMRMSNGHFKVIRMENGKEMVDVSTQFNAMKGATSNMAGAGGDAGEQEYSNSLDGV